MKAIKTIAFMLFFATGLTVKANLPGRDPADVVEEMISECRKITEKYNQQSAVYIDSITAIQRRLQTETNASIKIDLLITKDVYESQVKKLEYGLENDITKLRYIKGMEIIKILYDKVLGLDHHFASVRTFSEISKMSNPNNYADFAKIKDVIKNNRDKKSFDLSRLLGQNIVASVIQTFSGLLNSGLSREDKERELAQVECILDFTLRMHNDLNLIFFETSYLQASNEEIKRDIELMFKDYTKPISYLASLSDCRSNDDWDNLKEKLNKYLAEMTTGPDKKAGHKMQVNLEFSIDKLLQFIAKYNNFIDDGVKFYQKFKTILNSYENEKQCESKLPIEYKKLKDDIEIAIQKFNIAYKPVEINGTKMKEILYGINEYE
jgi:hypothetical protein